MKWYFLFNFSYYSLLHAAVEYRKKEIVRFLLSIDGINKDILNQVLNILSMMFFIYFVFITFSYNFNETPLNIAEYNGFDEIKELFI